MIGSAETISTHYLYRYICHKNTAKQRFFFIWEKLRTRQYHRVFAAYLAGEKQWRHVYALFLFPLLSAIRTDKRLISRKFAKQTCSLGYFNRPSQRILGYKIQPRLPYEKHPYLEAPPSKLLIFVVVVVIFSLVNFNFGVKRWMIRRTDLAFLAV